MRRLVLLFFWAALRRNAALLSHQNFVDRRVAPSKRSSGLVSRALFNGCNCAATSNGARKLLSHVILDNCNGLPSACCNTAPSVPAASAWSMLRGGASSAQPGVAPAAAATLALDKLELLINRLVKALSLVVVPLYRVARGLFGLSLLFYGERFSTLAFHIICFRLAGWKRVASHLNDLGEHYRSARGAMSQLGSSVGDLQAAKKLNQERIKAARTAMLKDEKRMMADGILTEAEKREFANKYREEIDAMVAEQNRLQAASSSVRAVQQSVSMRKISSSLHGLHAAAITSLTASTFKLVGQITLALHCGSLLRRVLLDLLGPIVDPVGFRLELDNYVATSENGAAVSAITAVSIITSGFLVFAMQKDPGRALKFSMVFLGGRIVADLLEPVAKPLRHRLVKRRPHRTPILSAVHLVLTVAGYSLHNTDSVPHWVASICHPFIGLLGVLNDRLSTFGVATINYLGKLG